MERRVLSLCRYIFFQRLLGKPGPGGRDTGRRLDIGGDEKGRKQPVVQGCAVCRRPKRAVYGVDSAEPGLRTAFKA